VVYRAAEPAAVNGADEVLPRRIEHVYFDRGDDEPAYAPADPGGPHRPGGRHRDYSFLTSESDPDATDFTEATKLLQTQLAKAAPAFAR
jgi:hypothetical protein